MATVPPTCFVFWGAESSPYPLALFANLSWKSKHLCVKTIGQNQQFLLTLAELKLLEQTNSFFDWAVIKNYWNSQNTSDIWGNRALKAVYRKTGSNSKSIFQRHRDSERT